MNLSNIYPLDLFSKPEESIPAFFSSLLIRTNFISNLRSYLGWRGLKISVRYGESWTCRIKGMQGVYGIYYNRDYSQKEWISGVFSLYYFPKKGEEIIDDFPSNVAEISQAASYTPFVRDFLAYPQASAFEIGHISLSFSSEDSSLICTLRAPQKSFSGIQNNLKKELANFELCLPFYKVLAATLTYNLGNGPSALIHRLENNNQEEIHIKYGDADLNSYLDQELIYRGSDFTQISSWDSKDSLSKPFENELWWDVHTHPHFTKVDKAVLGIDERPQFIILSGFLGSGKTTFLKHLIEYHTQNNRFVAVIQNEIGERGLDASLLEDSYAVLEIDEGCICCSLVGQLKKGILQIMSNHRPDVIVLETSGLANPFNLLAELEEINHLVRFNSVNCLLDAKNFQTACKQSSIAIEQVKAADILLLNKIDLITKKELEELKDHLKTINPKVHIQSCSYGNINPAYLFANEDENRPLHKPKSSVDNDQHHHPNHEQENLSSKRLNIDYSLDKSFFEQMTKTLPKSIYRMKGVVSFQGDHTLSVVQYVNGRCEIEPLTNKKIEAPFLILIGAKNALSNINQHFFNQLKTNKQ